MKGSAHQIRGGGDKELDESDGLGLIDDVHQEGAFLVDIIYQPQTIAFIKFFVPAASNLVG